MTRRGQRAARRVQKRTRYADKKIENDAHALLPIELWAHVLTDERAGLTPLWRHAARATCRLWRAVLDDAPASLRDIPGPVSVLANRVTGMWRLERQLAWGRGRVVCASALARWIAGQRDTVRWTKGTVGRLCRQIALSVATPPCVPYIALTLAASGVPALIDRALGDVAPLCDPPRSDDDNDDINDNDDHYDYDDELGDALDMDAVDVAINVDSADTMDDRDNGGGGDDDDGHMEGTQDDEDEEDYGQDDGQGDRGALEPQGIGYESWWCASPKRYYSGWAFGRRGHPPARWTAAVGAAVVQTGDRAAISTCSALRLTRSRAVCLSWSRRSTTTPRA
nr:F-box domain [Pandoravirus massiliensis]